MDSVKVIYEKDPETGEANGVIHFYCSSFCRDRDFERMVTHCHLEAGEDVLADDGLVCEYCGTRISLVRSELL